MIHSYLVATFRNLVRRSTYQGFNIAGLSIGLAVSICVALYIRHELTYDHFHTKAGDIYRISGLQDGTWFASLSLPYSDAVLQQTFPEVAEVARFRRYPPKYIEFAGEKKYEHRVLFTDCNSKFFTFFDFQPVHGDLRNAFVNPNSAVVTRSAATRIFGKQAVVGQTFRCDSLDVTVTGVVEDLPSNTHFDFSVVISNDNTMAVASQTATYVTLTKPSLHGSLRSKLLSLEAPTNEFQKLDDCRLIPLKQLHFEGTMTYELKPAGNKTYLLVFGLIGSIILLLSCFNFVNLSIAVYAKRSREIAMRKISGASRQHIASQFILESVILSWLCIPITVAILELILPWCSNMLSIHLVNEPLQTWGGFVAIVGAITVVGLVAGAYPAIVLPRISCLTLFRVSHEAGMSSLNLRTTLVGFQITIMVAVLSAALIIREQMTYLKEKDLGFVREGIIKLKGAWGVDSLRYNQLKASLLLNPQIIAVSQGFVPGDEEYGVPFRASDSETSWSDLVAYGVDADYIEALGLKVLSSRFDINDPNRPRSIVLINESLVKRLGIKDPIGQEIVLFPGAKMERKRTIDGVFRDFHFHSLHHSITPMMLTVRSSFGSGITQNIVVKVKTDGLSETLDFISKTSTNLIPNLPLTPEFLDEGLAKLYGKERSLAIFSTTLLIIAGLLSIVGLVGLSSYMAGRRAKEIGIRKVLGANIQSIIQLVSLPFMKLSFFSFVFGSVLSGYLMNQWLQGFAYKTAVPATAYLFTLGALVSVLLVTVGWQALRASLADPVESLRSE